MLLDRLDVDAGELAARTGWTVKPEGACSGEVCVPLPAEVRTASGRIDATVLAGRLGMPLVADEVHGQWSLGPATVTGRTLATAQVPEVVLDDLEGRPFSLSSLRGSKVVVTAWASW